MIAATSSRRSGHRCEYVFNVIDGFLCPSIPKNGPRFIKVGRLVRYAQEDIDAYVDAQRVETANA
jgi:hypothetical protein